MSIDLLQEKIRKTKNPMILDFDMLSEHIPPQILDENEDYAKAYVSFCESLLSGLKDNLPGVRFSLSTFSLLKDSGIRSLKQLLKYAKKCGYYVLLDVGSVLSAQSAQNMAKILLEADSQWKFDGLVVSTYIGSDGIVPFTEKLKETKKDLFVVVRTSNKSAPEIQDLLTGSRLVHMAMADIVNRFVQPLVCRCGYSQVAIVAAASSADGLRSLRSKFQDVFMLLDGSDYPNANAKNCSFAFDKLGHGAAACVGTSVTAAWRDSKNHEQDYVLLAVDAVNRFKKNISRYITIL